MRNKSVFWQRQPKENKYNLRAKKFAYLQFSAVYIKILLVKKKRVWSWMLLFILVHFLENVFQNKILVLKYRTSWLFKIHTLRACHFIFVKTHTLNFLKRSSSCTNCYHSGLVRFQWPVFKLEPIHSKTNRTLICFKSWFSMSSHLTFNFSI